MTTLIMGRIDFVESVATAKDNRATFTGINRKQASTTSINLYRADKNLCTIYSHYHGCGSHRAHGISSSWIAVLLANPIPCFDDVSNGNIFHVTGPLCWVITGHRWIPSQGPERRSFGIFLDLCINKRLSKQSRRQWFETQSRSLIRHLMSKIWFNWELFYTEAAITIPQKCTQTQRWFAEAWII